MRIRIPDRHLWIQPYDNTLLFSCISWEKPATYDSTHDPFFCLLFWKKKCFIFTWNFRVTRNGWRIFERHGGQHGSATSGKLCIFSSNATLEKQMSVRLSLCMYVCLSVCRSGLGENVIFSAPNWDMAPIFCVQNLLINEHLFCKYFVRLSVGNVTKVFMDVFILVNWKFGQWYIPKLRVSSFFFFFIYANVGLF